MISVELTEQEAELFVLFRKHQKSFQILLDNGIFDFKHGYIEIHRNKYGELKQIKRILTSYQAKK